jgi:hypothetical protein
MPSLPDDALVVRGGLNLPENFAQGSGVIVAPDGRIEKVSVNAGAGASITDLTATSQTGYAGIPHRQIGVTTVGAIRAAGGEVTATPTRKNPFHATLSGLTPEEASKSFRPTIKNPRWTA